MHSSAASPIEAVAGSESVAAGLEVRPVKEGLISNTPAVELPCYMPMQY